MTTYKIKPLEFRLRGCFWEAGPEWAEYVVFEHKESGRFLWMCGTRTFECDSIEDGKSQCQSHWEATISQVLELA